MIFNHLMGMRPYLELMRLDKPIGIWLLFLPAAWAVGFNAINQFQLLFLMVMMLLGAIFTRSAGCVINDLIDRRLDIAVERTRNRPLASGTVTVPQAIILVQFLLLLALLIVVRLPQPVFYLALLALPMIAAYPFMKRYTWWPQAFLGITFNLGVLMGWVATEHPLAPAAFTLYLAAIFWTLGYDTIYAVQDMDDDARIGIRSSARIVGHRLRSFIGMCYTLMFALLIVTGLLMHANSPYYIGLAVAAYLARRQVTALPCLSEYAGAIFRSNQWLGLVILAGILASRLVA